MSDAPATPTETPEQPKLSARHAAFVAHYLVCFSGAEAARRAGFAPRTARQQASRLLTNVHIKAAIEARMAEVTMAATEVLARLDQQARSSLADVMSFETVRKPTTVRKPVGAVIDDLRAQMAFEADYAERAGLDDVEVISHTSEMKRIERRILRLEMELERDPAATADVPGPAVELQVPVIDLAHAADEDKLHLIRSYNGKDDKVELYDAQAALQLLGKHHKLFTDKVEHSGAVGTVPLTLEEWKAQAAERRAAAEATLAAFEKEAADAA